MRETESLSRSPWAAVVNPHCTVCSASGWREKDQACLCIWRGIFDQCYERFCVCLIRSGYTIRVLRINGAGFGPKNRVSNARYKTEEFLADFQLVGLRALPEPELQQIFVLHFLRGLPQSACCRQLGMDRGTFYRAVYKIKTRLGYAFANTKPFVLYPVDQYFGATCDKTTSVAPFPLPEPRHRNGIPLRPPLAEAIPEPEPLPMVTGPVIVATPHPPFDATDATARVEWIRKQVGAGYTLRRIAAALNRWRIKPPDLTTRPMLVKRALPNEQCYTELIVKLEMLSSPVPVKRVYQRRAA